MTPKALCELAVQHLADLKAHDLIVCDVRDKTNIADFFVIVTSTSTRHGQALADDLIKGVKQAGGRVLGMEGFETSEWILVDLGDVIVHIMQYATREFYDLEGLWQTAEV